MRRKLLVFLVIPLVILAVLIISGGGYFYWLWYQEKLEIGWPEKLKNYKVEATINGRVVENKHVGLSFKIPQEWDFIENHDIMNSRMGRDEGLTLFGADMELRLDSPYVLVPEKGCLINVFVRHDKERAQRIRDEMAVIETRDEENNVMITEVSHKKALKETSSQKEELSKRPNAFFHISVEVPIKNRVYFFGTFIPFKDEERCTEEFDEFLQNVTIY